MKLIQLKVTSFVRKNTEVFLLMLLLVVSTLIIQVYNSQSKKVDSEYLKILRNTYFKTTINHIFFNLTPRYEQIDYSVKSGQTLKQILKEFSVKDEEIKSPSGGAGCLIGDAWTVVRRLPSDEGPFEGCHHSCSR